MHPILENLDKIIRFRQTLNAETDRGVALVCAAYLSEELRTLLENSFVDEPHAIEKLFEGTGPLATFSSRIELAFAIGVLPAESHRALHLIRRVRNDFAHEYSERTFGDPDISGRCRELVPLNPFLEERDPRKLFIRAVLAVLAEIHAKRTSHAVKPQQKPLDTVRDSFVRTKDALNTLMANLTEEQILRLHNPETRMEEKKRLILDTLAATGREFTEKDLV